MERYAVQMQISGEWKDWGRTDDIERAYLMLKTACCYGICRIFDRKYQEVAR